MTNTPTPALPSGAEDKFLAVVSCADCGKEITRAAKPCTEREKSLLILSAPLQNFRCPDGCRSTYSDMNANIDIAWEKAL